MTLNFGPLDRNLFASVATAISPTSSLAVGFVRAGFDTFLKQFLSYPGYTFYLRWKFPYSDKFHMSSGRSLRWSRIDTSQNIEWIAVTVWDDSLRSSNRDPAVAGITFGREIGVAKISSLELSIKMHLLDEQMSDLIQTQLASWAKNAFVELQSLCGYITTDWVGANVYGSESPYERYVGASYQWAAREFRVRSRGYYWGNLLSTEDVSRLGGAVALAQYPFVKVESLGSAGHYLQLTDNLREVDLLKLKSLKNFFSHLLPEGQKQDALYYANLPKFLL